MNTKKIVRDMIGKNQASQYTYNYPEKKYNPITAPTEYFKILKVKKPGQNRIIIRGPSTRKQRIQQYMEQYNIPTYAQAERELMIKGGIGK
jgi:hypothetical protein